MNLTEIKKLSPVKIEYGCYTFQYRSLDRVIEIDNTVSDNDKMESLLHEIGHATCHKNKCRCMANSNDSHTLAEYHAARFTMKHIQGNRKLIAIFIANINYELQKEHPSAHKTAARRIIKLKAWSKLQ